MTLRGALLVTLLVAGISAATARADGDPASDYLVEQPVFLDAKVPAKEATALAAAVRSANRQGFPVRVALVSSKNDLGSVTSLWGKPRTYAHFLGLELGFVYTGRLLVVMPNGIGFYWRGHRAVDVTIPVTNTPAGLATAATEAVRRLASSAGVTVTTSVEGAAAPRSAQSTKPDYRDVVARAVAGALVLGAAALLLERRSRRPRRVYREG